MKSGLSIVWTFFFYQIFSFFLLVSLFLISPFLVDRVVWLSGGLVPRGPDCMEDWQGR